MEAKDKLKAITSLKVGDTFEAITDRGEIFIYKFNGADDAAMKIDAILKTRNGDKPQNIDTRFYLSYNDLFNMKSIRILNDIPKQCDDSSNGIG